MATSSRVVIDSNVWISAALSSSGAPAQVVARVLARGTPVFSPETLAELESRLWRPKFDRYLSMDVRRRILHDANAASHWVELPDPPPEVLKSAVPVVEKADFEKISAEINRLAGVKIA